MLPAFASSQVTNHISIRKMMNPPIERFHSRGQQPCKCIGTKEIVYIRKEFSSHRIGLGHQHGRRFIGLVHQYGCRDVMPERSIGQPDSGQIKLDTLETFHKSLKVTK